MNDIREIRYSCVGACFGFGASAVGIYDMMPAIARLLGFFAVLAFLVCAVTLLTEAILYKNNEPTPVRTEQAHSAKQGYIEDNLSIAENFGNVNCRSGEKDEY